MLYGKLQVVVNFCNMWIREINPHPSLDQQADIALPETMVDVHDDSKIPSQSTQEGNHKKDDKLFASGRKGCGRRSQNWEQIEVEERRIETSTFTHCRSSFVGWDFS